MKDAARLLCPLTARPSQPAEHLQIKLWELTSEGKLKERGSIRSHGFEVAFSPDSKRLAGVDRQAINIWDKIDGQWRLVTTLLHRRLVTSIEFADNNRLVSGGEDGLVKIWNVSDVPNSVFVGNRLWYFGLDVSIDGTVAFADGSNAIVLWNSVVGGTRLLRGHDEEILTVAYSPDGNLLASGGLDGKVLLWDVRSRGQYVELLAGQHEIWSLAFAPNGTLVAGDSSGNLWLWEDPLVDKRRLRTLPGADYRGSIFRVQFSPTGALLAIAGGEYDSGYGRSEVWRMSLGEPSRIAQYELADIAYTLEFIEDERRLVVANRIGDLQMYDLTNPERNDPVFETTTPPFFIHSMKQSPDGSRLLTASPNGQIRFWQISDDSLVNVGRFTLRERVREIAFTGNDSLVTASEEGWVRIWPFSPRNETEDAN